MEVIIRVKPYLLILVPLLTVGCSSSFCAETTEIQWKQVKDQHGIQVYTRTIEGFNIIEFKGITRIETSMASLLALIRDIEATPQWVANCTESKILKRISDNETYTYSLSNAPWPVQNRDAVVHNVISIDPKTSVVTVRQTGHPDYMKEKKKVIRVRRLEGFWQFTPKEQGQIEVVYQLLSDPSGKIPAWLINASIVSQPYETLLSMKKIVRQKKYQNACPQEAESEEGRSTP